MQNVPKAPLWGQMQNVKCAEGTSSGQKAKCKDE